MSRTNYTKFALRESEEITEPVPMPDVTIEEDVKPESTVDFMEGFVNNCTFLNVRAEPTLDAEILRKISVNTYVMIDPRESTEEFYKVWLADASEGFCMKNFIEIK